MSGNFTNRHHVEPRVKLDSPREESFPIPLKHIDVSRSTHPNGWPGDGVPKARPKQAAADSRMSRTCVYTNTSASRVAHAGEEG